ncbi:hypothetical protein ACA910_018514 [Epithemia clementina (nom. ined.)]
MPNSITARQNLIAIMNRKAKRKPYNRCMEAAKTRTRWNIIRGDKVQVIGNHREKGKQGIVKKVLRKFQRLVVEGVNMATKLLKGDPDRGIPGGRPYRYERSIAYHRVMLLDPIHNVPTRIVRKVLEDGTKVRIAKKSGSIIPKPELSKIYVRKLRTNITDKCTSEDDAWEMTYVPPPPLIPFFRKKRLLQTTDGDEERFSEERKE